MKTLICLGLTGRMVDLTTSSTASSYPWILCNAQSANIPASRAHRTLDDEQLDSGDDENRHDRLEDRMDETADGDDYGETVNIMDVGLARAPVPATNDSEVGDDMLGI